MAKYVEGLTWDVGEPTNQKKLNQMVGNLDWLYDKTVKVRYSAHGLSRTQGIRIASGVIPIGPRPKDDRMTRDVYFGNFFTTGCRPIVQATLAQSDRPRSFITIRGVGGNGIHPTHNGFRAVVEHQTVPGKKFSYPRQFWVHWIAFGY